MLFTFLNNSWLSRGLQQAWDAVEVLYHRR